MHTSRLLLLLLNVVGGVAVLGSYWHGLRTHPDAGAALWGGIPITWRGPYSACMPLAAVGYLLFWSFLNFRVDPVAGGLAGRPGLGPFLLIFAAILIPSALWMPLTFRYLAEPSPALWLLIRAGLALTGLAAIAMLAALVALRPREPAWHYWLAIAGSVPFAVQTAILDALLWPAYFHRPPA